jgi:Na+-translocating ferredoxin:NAD+ oxidoreductase subunit C
MMSVRGFRRGGVTLPQRLAFSHDSIENAFLPIHAKLTLRAGSSGKEARLLVSEGEELREGQLIARADGKGTTNAHSSIPGIVRRIVRGKSPDGSAVNTVVVSLAGSFSISGKRPERYIWKSLNKTDILHLLQEKGVTQVSTGVPLYDLLHGKKDGGPVQLVVNALEMDPYRRVEEAILIHHGQELIDACDILNKILKPESIAIALDAGLQTEHTDALRALAKDADLKIAIEAFKRRYPQDMPLLIERALREKRGAQGAMLCLEPSTLMALHEAVVSNKAHIEQYVYVGGGAIKEPRIVKARIGTSLGDLFEECGGFKGLPERVVINGPLCGTLAADLDSPIEKTTRSVLALSHEETHSGSEQPCIRCGVCVRACPEGLKPYLLFKLLVAGRAKEAFDEGLSRCTSCAACAYACWSRLPLVELFDQHKAQGQSHA